MLLRSSALWRLLLTFLLLSLSACGDSEDYGEGMLFEGKSDAAGSAVHQPSVILISIDSLRADHCTPYGYKPPFAPNEETTPFLSRLASEGLLYENASAAAPWTLPSHISLFTGKSPREHGVRLGAQMLPHNNENIAGRFQSAGYDTYGVYSAPFLHPAYGYGFGFNGYIAAEEYLREGANENAIQNPKLRQMMKVHGLADSTYANAPRVNEIALNYLNDRKDQKEKPFFLFLHYWDVHYNYMPTEEEAKRFLPDYTAADAALGENFTPSHGDEPAKEYSSDQLLRAQALYDAEIRAVDDAIAEIYAKLEELGLQDDVIFAVVSDHGDHFGEVHEGKAHMFHHRTLYQEVVHVPVIIRAPKLAPKGQRVKGTMALYDVGPTLLDLAGLDAWPGRSGQSTRLLWEQPHKDFEVNMDLVHPGEPTDSQAWREGPFKAIWERGWHNPRTGQKLKDEFFRIFDLAQDPGESKPMTELAGNTLADKAKAIMRRLAESMPRAEQMKKLPDELEQGLKNSGYVDSFGTAEGSGSQAETHQDED